MKEANLDDLKGAGLPEKVAKTYKKHYKINKFKMGMRIILMPKNSIKMLQYG